MDGDLLAALYLIVAPAGLAVSGYAARDSSPATYWGAGAGVIALVLVVSIATTSPSAWLGDALFAVMPGAAELALLRQPAARTHPYSWLALGPAGYAAGWLAALAIASHLGIGA